MPALVSSCDEDDDGPDVGPRDAGPFGSSSDETSSSSEDVFHGMGSSAFSEFFPFIFLSLIFAAWKGIAAARKEEEKKEETEEEKKRKNVDKSNEEKHVQAGTQGKRRGRKGKK